MPDVFRFRCASRAALALAAAVLLGLGALVPSAGAKTISGLKLAEPQPSEDALAPGLAVEYLHVKVRHVDEVEAAGKGKPGEPLAMLDWATGPDNVLTSGRDDEVGARITGYIRFPDPGTYIMTIQSNDGVRLLIGGEKVIEDPDVHGDRFSDYVNVEIAEAGWYELYLVYFERKGTATLELYWQRPGADSFEYVPAEVFAHPR